MAETKTTSTKTTEQVQAGDTTIDGTKRAAQVVDTTPQTVVDGTTALVTATDPDSVEGLYEDADTDAVVVLKQDVMEEFVYPGTKRPSYRVLFHKGQTVLKSQLAARAAEIRLANADRTKLENYIDPTTFASGTGFGALAQEQSPTGTAETK